LGWLFSGGVRIDIIMSTFQNAEDQDLQSKIFLPMLCMVAKRGVLL
jgi:hypothetical protein